MKILQMAVCVTYLSALLLGLPIASEAGAISCQAVGNDLWGQWGNGTLPQTDATVTRLLQIKQDCPQLDTSMRSMVDGIKAHRQKEAAASGRVKKAGEKYQSSAYDPAGIRTGRND